MGGLRTFKRSAERLRRRSGVATLDYIMILGIVLPLLTFIVSIGPKIMRLAYEMTCVLISWPFM